MKRSSFIAAASAIALGGCAAHAQVAGPPAGSMATPPAVAAEAAATPQPPLIAPTPAEANLQAWSTPVRFENPGRVPMPIARSAGGPTNMRAWIEGSTYRLATSPERVSDIMLQPGETLIAVAAGDTARWVIGDTASGAGPARRTHVLVKPSGLGLRTNLVITTDRRVYHVELESSARAGAASLAWTYPPDDILALGSATGAPAREASPADLVLEALNFGYRVEGDSPSWRPIRAFDDGRQVFIEFPEGVERREVPPLFVVGASGAPELVNYRQRGRFYVVDRLFDVAELRLGERRQQIVRIVRGDAPRRGRRS